MTAFDGFDPFERRIASAIDEIADARQPTYLDDVFELTAHATQRRGRLALWRPRPMNRLALSAALTTIVAIAVSGGAIFLANRPGAGALTNTPSSAPSASAPAAAPSAKETPLASYPGWGRGLGFASKGPALVSEATWIADAGPITGLAHDPRIALVPSSDGMSMSIRMMGTTTALKSLFVVPLPSELDIVLADDELGCSKGTIGIYGLYPAADARSLELVVKDDACSPRSALLGRTWVRSFDADNRGGNGVVAAFDPLVQMTLPAATWSVKTHHNATEILGPDLAAFLLNNPEGFTANCTADGGEPRPVPFDLDSFEAYVRSIEGFTVTATDETIGGRPARHLAVVSSPTTSCPRGSVILEFRTKVGDAVDRWQLGMGDPDSIDLVETPNGIVVIQLIANPRAAFDTASVLASVRFPASLAAAAAP